MGDSSQTILIVDDEPNIRLMLRTTLAGDGYRVREANSSTQAIESIEREVPDLLVLDLRMPPVDGTAVLEFLRRRPLEQRLPTIVLTAYGSVPVAVNAIRLGAVDFLEKPITPDELRKSVASALLARNAEGQGPDDEASYDQVLQRVRKEIWQQHYADAEALLNKLAAQAHGDPAYLNLLGVLHKAEGSRRLAKKFYKMALRADSEYAAAIQNLRRLFDLETYGRTDQDVVLGDKTELLNDLFGEGG